MRSLTPMDDAVAALFSGTTSVVALVFYALFVVASWKMFTKAGYAGILSLIPIVNLIVIVKIAGYSGWMVLWYIIPIANIVMAFFVALRLGANFGKGGAFSFFLLWLFPIVGYFIIGLGSATYRRVDPRARG